MRLKAPLMSPYDSGAVESYVVIARRIACIAATPASDSASAAAGVDAHLSMTRQAPARRSTSRPTTTASTAHPVSASLAHSLACCAPHVRTPLAGSSSAWTNTKVARGASSASGSLWGKYRDPWPGERVHLLVVGREPRCVWVFEKVVERQPSRGADS